MDTLKQTTLLRVEALYPDTFEWQFGVVRLDAENVSSNLHSIFFIIECCKMWVWCPLQVRKAPVGLWRILGPLGLPGRWACHVNVYSSLLAQLLRSLTWNWFSKIFFLCCKVKRNLIELTKEEMSLLEEQDEDDTEVSWSQQQSSFALSCYARKKSLCLTLGRNGWMIVTAASLLLKYLPLPQAEFSFGVEMQSFTKLLLRARLWGG